MPPAVGFKNGTRVKAIKIYMHWGRGTVVDHSFFKNELYYSVRFDSKRHDVLVSSQYLKKI
jgi:hypothetical protein